MENQAIVEQEWQYVLNMMPPDLEDSALAKLALQRRREVSSAADLLRLALSLLSDRAGAEDVVQDVFVGFAGSARTFRLTGSLKSYLATCTANAARNKRKATARRATASRPSRWPRLSGRTES